jgi:hypothetical protein
MKLKSILFTGLLVGLALASSFVEARGWHGGVGIYMGGPFYGPPPFAYSYGYPYGYPYMYSPPPVIINQPPQPQVYIEQGNNGQAVPSQPVPATDAANGQSTSHYWYYCEQADGYYPYVKECPAGWKQVTPSPPPATSAK